MFLSSPAMILGAGDGRAPKFDDLVEGLKYFRLFAAEGFDHIFLLRLFVCIGGDGK